MWFNIGVRRNRGRPAHCWHGNRRAKRVNTVAGFGDGLKRVGVEVGESQDTNDALTAAAVSRLLLPGGVTVDEPKRKGGK